MTSLTLKCSTDGALLEQLTLGDDNGQTETTSN